MHWKCEFKLQAKDLLIGMDGNFHLNFWGKNDAYLNQRSVRIRSANNSTVSTMQAFFELSPYIKARENNVSRTTVGHLSDKDLKSLYLICPCETPFFKPKESFEAILEKIILSKSENQRLASLRDWLLPMLMNGQVRVSPTATPEPAPVSERGQLALAF
jgi:type I restriction enzyme, S subunit